MPRGFWVPSIALAAVTLGACGSQGGASSSRTPTTPSAPNVVTVTSLSISGYPPILRVGATAAVTATASFSDGSSREVPAACASSTPAVLHVTADPATGYMNVLKGVADGEAEFRATWSTATATARIVVREPASLQDISGTVREAGARDLPLPNVRVQISGGSRDGLFVTTDERGRFDFPELFETGIDLLASRPGYQNARFRVALLPRDQVADIRLPPAFRIIEQVFDGTLFPDCLGQDATRSLRLTPRTDGVLLVTEARVSDTGA